MSTPTDDAASSKKRKQVIGAVGASLVAVAVAAAATWTRSQPEAGAAGALPPSQPISQSPSTPSDPAPQYVGWKEFPQVCLGLTPEGKRVALPGMETLDVMQYPAVGVFRDVTQSDGGVEEQWNTVTKSSMVWIDQPKPTDPPKLGVSLTVENPGDWRLWVTFSPFVYAITAAHNFTTKDLSVSEEVAAGPMSVLRTAKITVLSSTGSPAKDVEVALSSMLRDPDPMSMVTDASGQVTLTCINTATLDAFVDDDVAGCFDGTVQFSKTGTATIQLVSCSTDGGT